jgi:hypothetical protein
MEVQNVHTLVRVSPHVQNPKKNQNKKWKTCLLIRTKQYEKKNPKTFPGDLHTKIEGNERNDYEIFNKFLLFPHSTKRNENVTRYKIYLLKKNFQKRKLYFIL